MPAVEDAVANQNVVSFSSAAAIASPAPVNEPDLNACEPADGIVGQSPALNEVLQRVRRVAPTDMADSPLLTACIDSMIFCGESFFKHVTISTSFNGNEDFILVFKYSELSIFISGHC